MRSRPAVRPPVAVHSPSIHRVAVEEEAVAEARIAAVVAVVHTVAVVVATVEAADTTRAS